MMSTRYICLIQDVISRFNINDTQCSFQNVFEFLENKKVFRIFFYSFQEQALASSKTSRDKEWEAFKADIEDRSSH